MAKKKEEVLEIIPEDDVAVGKTTKQKEVLTLFLFLVPLLLMAYSSDWVVKFTLFFYEAVLLKNYIMDQYRRKEA